MDHLLDEVDSLPHADLSLPHPDLSSLAGSWCESCETLRQEVKRLQDDQLQNFGKLKQKIISTDLLIKKYKTKCDDYDNQSKRLEETTRRLEKAQRQSETLELQLKSSLLETEPLRKSKYSLEVELRTKNAEVEDAVNKMLCAQGLQRQIQGENKYLQDQVDKLEAEKKDLKEKVHAYKQKEKDGESVKQLKVEVASLKREISSLKKESMKQVKKEQTLETKLQETVEKMNHYCNMLRQHKLLTAAKKSLPHHRSPGRAHATSDSDTSYDTGRDSDTSYDTGRGNMYSSPGRAHATSDSDTSYDAGRDSSLLHKDIRKSIEESESSDDDDDDHSVFQVPWAFSPMVKCLSPLPPSPVCFAQKQGSLEEDDDDEDDEYLSDLAEELENQLMDILSEDEITDVGNTKTSNVISQQAKTCDTGRGIAATNKADGAVFNSLADKGESFLETIAESVEPNLAEAVKCNGAIGMEMSEEEDRSEEDSNGSPVKFDDDNDDDDTLSAELAEAAGASDSVYKDILDNIVNEILGDTIGEAKGDEHVGESIEQTVYCDDTTLIRTPVRKTKSDLKPQIEESHDTDSQGDTSNIEMFKSPKSLKERLRDATQIISPVNTRQRSAQKLAKSKGSPCVKKADSDVIEDSDSKDSLDNAQNNKCSENTGDQNVNLNRSDTGEFTPAIHEVESPSTVSKEKTGFFIPGQESTCVHSMKDLNINVTKNDGDSAATREDDSNEKKLKSINDNAGSPKPVLKRQMALRKDSASEIPEKKFCSEPDDTSQSSYRASRRITRSKSMPNKFIKFQKGSCETLEEERAKFDVSKGGYEKPNKNELDTIKDCKVALEIIYIDGEKHVDPKKVRQIDKSAAKQNDTPIDTQNDASLAEQNSTPIAEQKISLTKHAETPIVENKSDTPIAKTHTPIAKQKGTPDKIDKPLAKLPDTPIARRTRRSSRLQSLPESNTDKTSKRRSASSKLVPSKDETKNSDITEKDSLTNDTSNNSKSSVLHNNNDEKSERDNEQKDELIEKSSVFEQEPTKCETGNTSLQKIKAIEDLPLDFKEDSIKSVSENIADNSSNKINIDSKGEVSISSPDIANSENSANKATPSRQLSTGFLLQSHQSSCKQREHTSPFRLKETIIEENDTVTKNNSDGTEASVILDVNDILNDSVNERSINKQTDMSSQKDVLKDKGLLTENTAISKDLMEDVDNKDSKADKTEQLSEDIASPVASPFDLFKSASQSVSVTKDSNSDAVSPVSGYEPGTSGNKSVTSRSGSVTPADNFSESDTPVPSPLPMSLFEMVELISPLPPTPTPMDEPLSPLLEDEDHDKTLTEDDVLKSPEANVKTMPDITLFNTPESKPYSKMDLHFTPLPVMLSPIVTPKRPKSVESATQIDTQVNDSAQKPCQFINQVPTGVSIKPKPVHASELNETVTQELDTEIDGMENKLSKDDTSPSHKENVVPNTNAQHSVKSKPLKLIQTSHTNSTENIFKIGAKEKATKAGIVLNKLKTNLDKDTPDTVDRIQSKLSAIQKTPGDSEKTATETKPRNTIPEMAGGYDNLVASKTKKRQAHQNKIPRLPVKKPIPIIEAPVLLPVNRKRKSTETVKDKEEEKKTCKENVFKRRQKNESKEKTVVSKLMQNFLKSDDPPESVIAKFEAEPIDTEEIRLSEKVLNICFDCLSRMRNDTLDGVYDSCTTGDYLNVIEDWPYLCNIEKQAVDLCWHLSLDAKLDMPRAAIMKELWDRIFSNEHGTSISGKKSLTRLFTAMCFKGGNVEEVRVLFYHIVVCGYMNATSFLVPVISVWPETFTRENDEDHGMVMVMEHIMMQTLTSQDTATNKQICECAMKLCYWVVDRDTADNIVAKLLKKLENTSDLGKSFEIRKSIEVLVLKEGCDWFYKNFVIAHLQRMSNKYQCKGNKCGLSSLYVCSLLKISGTFLAQYHERQKQFNDAIRNWILPILRKEPSCNEIRECTLEVLLEVSCFNSRILNNIQGWYYHFKGTVRQDLEHRMEVLRTEFNSKFTTVIHPFVKKNSGHRRTERDCSDYSTPF